MARIKHCLPEMERGSLSDEIIVSSEPENAHFKFWSTLAQSITQLKLNIWGLIDHLSNSKCLPGLIYVHLLTLAFNANKYTVHVLYLPFIDAWIVD